MSWHLRYYEYSYMYYIVGSAVLCLTYTIIYCVKMPVNKIKNLKDVIDYDPQGPNSIDKKKQFTWFILRLPTQ